MKRLIVDDVTLMRLRDEGKTYAEIGRIFNCSTPTLLRRSANLKRRMEALPELFKKSELSKDNIDGINQLSKINQTIMDELERAKRLILREDDAVKEREALEDQIKNNRGPLDGKLVELLKEKVHVSFNNILKIQSNIISISAEVRKQIELQLKIAETLYNATAMAQFQETILDVIGKIHPSARDAVVLGLKEFRKLQGLIKFNK